LLLINIKVDANQNHQSLLQPTQKYKSFRNHSQNDRSTQTYTHPWGINERNTRKGKLKYMQIKEKEILTEKKNKTIHEKRVRLTDDVRKSEQIWADAKKKS